MHVLCLPLPLLCPAADVVEELDVPAGPLRVLLQQPDGTTEPAPSFWAATAYAEGRGVRIGGRGVTAILCGVAAVADDQHGAWLTLRMADRVRAGDDMH